MTVYTERSRLSDEEPTSPERDVPEDNTLEESVLGCAPPASPGAEAQSTRAGGPDNLGAQLDALRLRVSPETQQEITKVLESLKGKLNEN